MSNQSEKDILAVSPWKVVVGRLKPWTGRRLPNDSSRSISPRRFTGFCKAITTILSVANSAWRRSRSRNGEELF